MEFHAVILCGPGRLLLPFSLTRASGVPKPLLPIANKPMLHYVLDWCLLAVFSQITIVCDPDALGAVTASLTDYPHVLILPVASAHSGQALHALYTAKSSLPLMLLPCDFITNLPPHVLIDAYRNMPPEDAGIAVYYRNHLDIDDKNHCIFPRSFSIYAHRSAHDPVLLDSYSAEDVRFHKSLPLRSRMCWLFPNASVAHDAQWLGIFLALPKVFDAFAANPTKFSATYFAHRLVTKVVRDLARMLWKNPKSNHGAIGYFCVPPQATFFRCNLVPVWMESQRHFMRIQAEKFAKGDRTRQDKPKAEKKVEKPVSADKKVEKASIDKAEKPKLLSVIGIDSCVDPSTIIGDKTNVKRLVVGPDCVIGKRVRITGCLVLHGCTIEDDAQLENCIVGHSATIGLKLRLVGCNVELTHHVPRSTSAKNEDLLRLSLEGIVPADEAAVLDDSQDASDSSGLDGSSEEDEDYHDEYTANDDGLFAY